MTVLILFLGFLFGAILQFARLNRYNTISGQALFQNFTVAKAIMITIGIGAILVSIEIGLGLASWHIKPLMLIGVMLGGIIFGTGMAILGYCPGTLPVSLGEGSLDALTGIIGGFAGGWVYTIMLPSIKDLLGPDLGMISLKSITGNLPVLYYVLVVAFGSLFIFGAFWIHKKEKASNMKWLYAGVALALLNCVVFLTAVTNRIIGASTFYPYASDFLTGTTGNAYFDKIKTPGHWEMLFLAGAFLAGLIGSLIRKDFKLVLIHDNWKKYKGDSALKRIIWAFIGGFILIFGARMAGGCTSGHIISGGMQLAASSLIFAVFVFAGLLLTGKVFYKPTR